MSQKKFIRKVYRKFTLVEGMYKNELLGFLKKIDPDSSIEINDIPDNLVADTYSYVITDSAYSDFRILILEYIAKNFLKEFGIKIKISH